MSLGKSCNYLYNSLFHLAIEWAQLTSNGEAFCEHPENSNMESFSWAKVLVDLSDKFW
jgi:hypothetical protein